MEPGPAARADRQNNQTDSQSSVQPLWLSESILNFRPSLKSVTRGDELLDSFNGFERIPFSLPVMLHMPFAVGQQSGRQKRSADFQLGIKEANQRMLRTLTGPYKTVVRHGPLPLRRG